MSSIRFGILDLLTFHRYTRRSGRPGRKLHNSNSVEHHLSALLRVVLVGLGIEIGDDVKKGRGWNQSRRAHLGRLHAFGSEGVGAILRRRQAVGVAEQHSLCRCCHVFTLQVFLNVHTQLAKLVDVDRLAVLTLGLANKPAFITLENYVELGMSIAKSRRPKTQLGQGRNDGMFEWLSLFKQETSHLA